MELDAFYASLAQAVAWCAPRGSAADPARSLRTDALQPRVLAPTRADVVESVCASRRIAMGLYQPPAVRALPDLAGGRLLAYFPDADLSDGAAEAETAGFFDVFNTPPWDCWVALFDDPDDPPEGDASYRSYVVAYVPPTLLGLAGRGVDVNPERCIDWLADTGTRLAATLRSKANDDGR